MSKHNNSLGLSSHARCSCGRHATIGEWQAGVGLFSYYKCPDCLNQHLTQRSLSSEQWYKQFKDDNIRTGSKTDP
jgi:hypothetical protein